MMNKIIRELKFDPNEEDCGVTAISLVTYPAIEEDFLYFSEDFIKTGKGIAPKKKSTDLQKLLDPVYGWKYWKISTRNSDIWKIDTSHKWCINHCNPNQNIYTVDQIHKFANKLTAEEKEGWIDESEVPSFTKNFKGIHSDNFNMDQQLFNCRHFLEPVRDIKEIQNQGVLFSKTETFSIDFAISDTEEKRIRGVVMLPYKLIPRRDGFGKEYSVWYSKETVRKYFEKYGMNRTITIQHEGDITGNAILTKSWIYEKDGDAYYGSNKPVVGSWLVEYQILNDKLWSLIKEKKIKGFSIEVLAAID